MTDIEKRDFLADEICKNIVGPGLTSDVFVCREDASNEILDDRPSIKYVAGILYPKTNHEETVTYPGEEINDVDNIDEENAQDRIDNEQDSTNRGREDNNVNVNDNDRTDFRPSNIGMIVCLDNDATTISVGLNYGIYHHISSTEVEQKVKVKLGRCSLETLRNTFKFYNDNEDVKALLKIFGCESMDDVFTIDERNLTISPKRIFSANTENNRTIYLQPAKFPRRPNVADDPVHDHLLPLLLQYNFFQREQMTISPQTIRFSNNRLDTLRVDDSISLYWKVVESKDNSKKYLKIQVQNENEGNSRIESTMFQTELMISSDHLVPYTEPHHSSIDDQEYTLNEELYRNLPIYGKGVNCGIMWDESQSTPQWIKTSYSPRQKATSFSSDTEYSDTNNVCNVFDMTIWSEKTKEELLNGLHQIVNDYQEWHSEQENNANRNIQVISDLLNEQEAFRVRLQDNIEYLRTNDRAYRCFLLANTAMYIQMCLARDPRFRKDRERASFDENDTVYKDGAWDYFRGRPQEMKYRPFQLAFLLMNVKSTFENDDPYRNDNVDLIWFPTGGGKTEAYLALTALTIAERRTSQNHDEGVSVIMRYTLRLLTAQQFERASFLICALEYLRRELNNKNEYQISLGDSPITLGMWIGAKTTPNIIKNLENGHWKRYFEDAKSGKPGSNPFPISYCPWCGCKMEANNEETGFYSGYNKKGEFHCINNDNCSFDKLPIRYIDEDIYNNPPTLLFATVDKFALLNSKEKGKLFGANTDRRRPDLIIQDELHLISGPLGSLVGMFETLIEEICTARDDNGDVLRRPKIVASTATTKNTLHLIKQLYTRKVNTFPVSGIEYSDNFFSHALPEKRSNRLYMGLAPTGHSASELEIHAIAAEIVSKEKLISKYLKSHNVDLHNREAVNKALVDDGSLIKDLDNYWTLVLYYMNLKSLGRTHSRMDQEILAKVNNLRKYSESYQSLDFVTRNFNFRVEEFTSRQESSRIKSLLIKAESAPKLEVMEGDKLSVNYNMDIVQATNMISVGIDIARWNVMYMIGQPLTTAEYIQSSSRVGRTTHGLVVNIYNTVRTRERSFYENYVPYHKEFYKFVEPLTVTTFTPTTFDKLINNLYLCYMGAIKGYDQPIQVKEEDLDELINIMLNRNESISNNKSLTQLIEEKLNSLHQELQSPERCNRTFKQLILDLDVMTSLRDIESNTYIVYNYN